MHGLKLKPEDYLRAHVIERLMYDFRISFGTLRERFGGFAEAVISEAKQIGAADRDGICGVDSDGFFVTAAGRPFCRSISAFFDADLGASGARHSIAV